MIAYEMHRHIAFPALLLAVFLGILGCQSSGPVDSSPERPSDPTASVLPDTVTRVTKLSTVVIPRPVPLTRVPRLEGKRLGEVRQLTRIARLQLVLGTLYVREENSIDSGEEDRIQIQSPRPGTRVTRGESIVCWTVKRTAAGQEAVLVPNLRGKPWSEASQLIESSGLKIMIAPRGSRDDPGSFPGNPLVRDQFPRPGVSVFRKTSLYLQLESDPNYRESTP